MAGTLEDKSIVDELESLDDEIMKMTTPQIVQRTKLIDLEIRIMNSDIDRMSREKHSHQDKIEANKARMKQNKKLPYLVSNIVELLELNPNEDEEDGGVKLVDSQRFGTSAVIKASTRQTVFLPEIGMVEPEDLKPGDLVGVNKDSFLVMEKIPVEYDSRVKAMEVDERPTDHYSDIGGLDLQIQELKEAVVLPITHKEKFKNLGIRAPKGVL